MTEMATIDWFVRWGTSVFSENTAVFFISALDKVGIDVKKNNNWLIFNLFFPGYGTCMFLEFAVATESILNHIA